MGEKNDLIWADVPDKLTGKTRRLYPHRYPKRGDKFVLMPRSGEDTNHEASYLEVDTLLEVIGHLLTEQWSTRFSDDGGTSPSRQIGAVHITPEGHRQLGRLQEFESNLGGGEAAGSGFFTHHWTEGTWNDNRAQEGEVLQHVAGSEFTKRGVRPGSTVYVVTDIGRQMYLCARMAVERLVGQDEAADFLGDDDIWQASEHCLCEEGRGTPMRFDRRVPDEVVRQLRFIGEGGAINPLRFEADGVTLVNQTLRGVRHLTAESATLLDALLGDEVRRADDAGAGVPYEAEEWHFKLHLRLERDRDNRLVHLKKKHVLEATGRLACEACDFDFAATYGELAEGFAECHHRKPVSTLGKGDVTREEHLAIVCANCHRVLHLNAGMTVEGLHQALPS